MQTKRVFGFWIKAAAVKTRLRDKALKTQNGAVARRFYLSGISNIHTARGIRDRDLHVALVQDFDPLSLQEHKLLRAA